MYKNIFIAILLLISSTAEAKYITQLGGAGVEVKRVFIHTNGAVSIYVTGEILNLDECTSTFRFYIPHDLPGKDSMLSTVLLAFTSGKRIGAHGSGCSTTAFWGGTVDIPIVNNLWIE